MSTPLDATPQEEPDADPTAVSGGIPAHDASPAETEAGATTGPPADETPQSEVEVEVSSGSDTGTDAGTDTDTGTGAGDTPPAPDTDRPSPFSSPADLQTAEIRDADAHLAESEDATAQAKEAAQQLRGSERPETLGQGTDLPASPDAETTAPQPR